jgi:hypothetical protein
MRCAIARFGYFSNEFFCLRHCRRRSGGLIQQVSDVFRLHIAV